MSVRLHRFLKGATWVWKRNARGWNEYKAGDKIIILSNNKSHGKIRLKFEEEKTIKLGKITGRIVSHTIPDFNIITYAKVFEQPAGSQYLLFNRNSQEYLPAEETWDIVTREYVSVPEHWRALAPTLDRLALLEHPYAWEIHKGTVNNDSEFLFGEIVHVPNVWKANVLKLRKARVYLGSKLPMEKLAGVSIRPGYHKYKCPPFEPRGLLCTGRHNISFHRTYEQAIAARLAGADNMRIVDLR